MCAVHVHQFTCLLSPPCVRHITLHQIIKLQPIFYLTQKVSEVAQTNSSHQLLVYSPRRNTLSDKHGGKFPHHFFSRRVVSTYHQSSIN